MIKDTIKESELNSEEEKTSFLTMFIDFLLGRGFYGPNRDKKLLSMYHQLKKSGYKFYNYKKSLITPAFADFLFSVYKAVAPLREFFLLNIDDGYYKNQVLNYTLSDKQRTALDNLLPEKIREVASKVPLKNLAEKGKEAYVIFRKDYSPDNILKINVLYNSVILLKQFSVLDYYASLRKLSSDIKENSFENQPKFSPMPKQYLFDFVIDFFNAFSLLLNIKDFRSVFTFLRTFPDFKNFDENLFNEMIKQCNALESKKVPELVTKLLKCDKDYEINLSNNPKDIVQPYADLVYQEFRMTIEDLQKERRLKAIKKMLDEAFEGNAVKKLDFYCQEESNKFREIDAPAYECVDQLNYLYTFLNLYIKNEFSSFVEVFEVQATCQRSNYVSSFARVFNTLKDREEEISSFDKKLDSKFQIGYKIASLVSKIKSVDSNARESMLIKLNLEVDGVNAMASSILTNTMKDIDNISSFFKELYADYEKNSLIMNWGEIDSKMPGGSSKTVMENINRHLRAFIVLMENAKMLK